MLCSSLWHFVYFEDKPFLLRTQVKIGGEFVRRWKWWTAWPVQIAEALAIGGLGAVTAALGAVVNGIAMFGAVPLLGAVTAYRATRRGLSNYLAWIAPPLCMIAAHEMIWGYFSDLAPTVICALTALVGAAAGEVRNQQAEQH